jgi:hypothetical protein
MGFRWIRPGSSALRISHSDRVVKHSVIRSRHGNSLPNYLLALDVIGTRYHHPGEVINGPEQDDMIDFAFSFHIVC